MIPPLLVEENPRGRGGGKVRPNPWMGDGGKKERKKKYRVRNTKIGRGHVS